jgi:hypothetical protein
MHVGENCDNAANVTGRLGSPGRRIEMFYQHLIHALAGGEDLYCGRTEL